MAKTRRRRMRQKKILEAESSITESDETSVLSVKPSTKPSRLRQSHKKSANSFSSEKPSQNPTDAEDNSKCGEICYNAVICHSCEDGEIALSVKTWLEQNILLQTGSSKRAPKVELIGKISSNYADSLEIASKRTKTIIILCTKRFCHDAKFKKATHALWTWEADATDLQVFPLFFGFEEGEPLPECISVKDAHNLHFKKDSEYFRYIMHGRLFLSGMEHLQHEDNSKVKQNEGKARQDSHQQGQDDERPVRSSRGIHNDCRLRSYGEIGTDERVVHDSGADFDSGVATSVTAFSVPMSMPSTNGWPPQPQSSLSGPSGLSPDPNCAHDSQMYVNTMTSQTSSTNSPGTPLANVREEVTECACSEENQISHKDDSGTLTKGTLCSQTQSIPAENPLSIDTSTSALCTAENLQRASASVNSCASLRVQNRPKLKENLESKICTENHVTHFSPDLGLGVSEICDQNSLMMQGKPNVTEDTDEQTDDPQLCASAPNSESNSVGSKSNNSLKLSRKDRRKELQDIPATDDGYLTPIACPMPCRHRLEAGDSDACDELSADGSEDQKLLDSGSFELNNTTLCVNVNPLVSRVETAKIRTTETYKPHEIKAERQKMLLAPATLPPPSHRYINSTARVNRPDDKTRTKRLSSMVQSQPSTMTVSNPIPKSKEAVVPEWDDYEYATTDSATNSSATWCQPGTVNIHNAASVNFFGTTGCHIMKEGQLLPIFNSEKSSDALTTYQTWPFIDNGRNQAPGPSEAPSSAHSGRMDSRGPQPLPRRGHDQTKDVFRPSAREGVPSSKARTKKKPYSAILSGLGVFLTCCRKKKREKARNTELRAYEMSPDTEDLYDYIPVIDLDTPTVFSK